MNTNTARPIDARKVKLSCASFSTYEDYSKAVNAIENTPTMDVIVPVRCKDCINGKPSRIISEKYDCRLSEYVKSPDGFCDWGIAKSGK